MINYKAETPKLVLGCRFDLYFDIPNKEIITTLAPNEIHIEATNVHVVGIGQRMLFMLCYRLYSISTQYITPYPFLFQLTAFYYNVAKKKHFEVIKPNVHYNLISCLLKY